MARPRKRKLPPGVTGLAEWKEAKRVAACNAAAREFMKLPPEERRRQLMDIFEVRVELPKPKE